MGALSGLSGLYGPTGMFAGASPILFRYKAGDSIAALGGSFSRASGGWQQNASGIWEPVVSGAPRDGHYINGVRHLLLEGQRTNLLLNSATLSSQSVTVTATAYTLSFYGTGTVTLSGASTAGPLVGTGAGNRVTLTFTPTAGTLTLTVSGSVTTANLEAGASASSPIVTTGATVTRAADVLWFPISFGPLEVTVYTRFVEGGNANALVLYYIGSGANPLFLVDAQTTGYRAYHRNTAATVVTSTLTTKPNVGDSTELVHTFTADGRVQLTQSIAGGAETNSTQSGAAAVDAAWSENKLSLNSNGAGTANGFHAFRDIIIAKALRDLSYMRSRV